LMPESGRADMSISSGNWTLARAGAALFADTLFHRFEPCTDGMRPSLAMFHPHTEMARRQGFGLCRKLGAQTIHLHGAKVSKFNAFYPSPRPDWEKGVELSDHQCRQDLRSPSSPTGWRASLQ